MITMQDFFEVTNYKISDGHEFLWSCYGPNVHILDSELTEDNDFLATCSIVFDKKTYVVYEAKVYDYINNRAYRMIHPDYKEAHDEESYSRKIDPDQAWDVIKFIDLDVKNDWIEKASAIMNGEKYDERVSIPLEFSKDELYKFMLIAHELDITLNQFFENVAKEAIDMEKNSW